MDLGLENFVHFGEMVIHDVYLHGVYIVAFNRHDIAVSGVLSRVAIKTKAVSVMKSGSIALFDHVLVILGIHLVQEV